MLRPKLRIPRAGSLLRPRRSPQQPLTFSQRIPAQFRTIHAVPTLKAFPYPEEGVPGLLSPEGFDMAYNQYMDFVVTKLNNLTAGTEFAEKDALQIVRETARQPHQAALFNYASMAWNHNFFFEQLARLESAVPGRPPEEVGFAPVTMPSQLQKSLEDQFGTIETLRREMTITADVMFGPGFVWLIKQPRTAEYRVLPTYLAGTPYLTAHWRRQGVDLNTHAGAASPDSAATGREYLDRAQAAVGATAAGQFDTPPGSGELIPLLCLSTWQHVWLRDWGIAGKLDFAEAWWDCVDWRKVEALALGKLSMKIK